MTVKELIELIGYHATPLIAKNAYDGKVLFDSRKNNRKYIKKYHNGLVLNIWADIGNTSYDKELYTGIIKCYVRDGSWVKEETR